MTTAGERDKRVQFQRRTSTENELGSEDEISWPLIEKAWAKVLYGAGAERRQAAMERSSQAATFIVLSTSKLRTVGEGDRIWFMNKGWDITSIAPVGRADIHFTATSQGS